MITIEQRIETRGNALGKVIGRSAIKIESAFELIRMKQFSLEEIAQATELPEEELRKMKKDLDAIKDAGGASEDSEDHWVEPRELFGIEREIYEEGKIIGRAIGRTTVKIESAFELIRMNLISLKEIAQATEVPEKELINMKNWLDDVKDLEDSSEACSEHREGNTAVRQRVGKRRNTESSGATGFSKEAEGGNGGMYRVMQAIFAEGKLEGIPIGIAKGKVEGKVLGRALGRAEMKLELAYNLIRFSQYPLSEISQITEVPEKELAKLKEELEAIEETEEASREES